MHKFYLFFIGLSLGITAVFSQTWKTYPYTPPGSLISFPQDEGRHVNEPVEWWYTTGHLTGTVTGKHYSYMLTYFYYPAGGSDGFRILTISDDDNQNFYPETAFLTYSHMATDQLNIQAQVTGGGTEYWHNLYNGNQILPFQYELSATSAYVSLDLSYDTFKKPLILGDDGYLLQGANNYTYYYSQTGVDVTGSISFDGITENVSGTGWIDRQYGSIMPSTNNQYEWFSVQLSNGMDFNLWNIFEGNQIPDNERYKILAGYIDENTQFTTADFQLERLAFAYMPDQQQCYAQSWHLTSNLYNIDLVITTDYSNSEIWFPFRFYEGSTHITGTVDGQNVTGVGFAELLHHYEIPDLQILNGTHWNTSIPVQWQLNNPDDGNPLTYDLAYSTDQINFQPLVSGLSTTQYIWDTAPFADGDVFWLKITGKSVDATINGSAIKEILYDSSAGINENKTLSIRIYPNPAQNRLYLKAPGIYRLEIIDMKAKIVKIIKIFSSDQVKIELPDLQGVYMLKIYTSKGITKRKIILE